MICAECTHWTPGEFWGTGEHNHGTVVDCKGWCYAKKNRRKRWNYTSAYDCAYFEKKRMKGLIMSGSGPMTEEQIYRLSEFLVENFEFLESEK